MRLPQFWDRCTFSRDSRSWSFEEIISFFEEDSRQPTGFGSSAGHSLLIAWC